MIRPLLRRLAEFYVRTGRWPRSFLAAAPKPAAAPRSRSFRPTLEVLEERAVPSITFAAAQTFSVGTTPDAVAAADLNGDGKPDVIAANAGSNTVSVLLNTSLPGATTLTFLPQQTFAVGTNPVAVAFGDVNGDGRQDIVTANSGNGTVTVLLNTTATGSSVVSFAAPQSFSVGASPRSVALGDMNGDGMLDVVTADAGSNTVTVLRNTASPGATSVSFSPQAFAVGSSPVSVAVGDINGDGRGDVVAANSGAGTVSVLIGTTPTGAGSVSFAAQQTFAVGASPVAVALGDVNGDGKQDLAVANAANTVSVLLNTAAGGASSAAFAAAQAFNLGTSPAALLLADLNLDGKADLVASDNSLSTVTAFQNLTPAAATTASFSVPLQFGSTANNYALAVADLNADARPDVVAVNASAGSVSVLRNTSPGPVSLSQSVVTLGTSTVAAGSAGTTVTLQERDANGVNENLGGDAVTFVLGNGTGQGTFSAVTDNHNGTYTATFSGTTAGSNTITATVNGQPLTSSAPTVTVTPGTASLATSVLTVTPNVVNVGGNATVTLRAKDAYGNNLTTGGVSVTFALGSGHGQGTISPVTDNGDGTYTATFTGTVAGANTITARIGGVPVATPPQSIAVITKSVYDVGVFAGQGVWEYSQNTGIWTRLTPTDATAVAVNAAGAVVGEFAGQGVYLYSGGVWTQLTAGNASMLGIDSAGNVVGEFQGAGVWRYSAGSWSQLTSSDASRLAVDTEGDVVAVFPSQGTWLYTTGTGWTQLRTTDASLVAIADGVVAADFMGQGVWRYTGAAGWRQLTPTDAGLLAVDAAGDVAAWFSATGLYEFSDAQGWQFRNGNTSALAMDAAGDLLAQITGANGGVWRYEPGTGWLRLSAGTAGILAIGG
jgi:hypothetical protein